MELNLLKLSGVAIWRQLEIEEALLRADDRNWCLINRGSPPSVIVGASGQVEQWVNREEVERQGLPVYRRFSGGGTVVVDPNTLFVTFVGRRDFLPCAPFPERVMRWTASIYAEAFDLPNFALRENDYVIGVQKCGGNAQYLRKERWLHHTSLLWDFSSERMGALQMPPRSPSYRSGRDHTAFLCRLCDHFLTIDELVERLVSTLERRFILRNGEGVDLGELLQRPHRKGTERLL